jgi:hypothetical protein
MHEPYISKLSMAFDYSPNKKNRIYENNTGIHELILNNKTIID